METNVSVVGSHYKVEAAVLIYQRQTGGHYVYGEERAMPDAIATVHHVTERAGRPVIGAGRAMSEADYLNMVKVLAPAERPQMVWQDQRVLARGLGRVIWWTPPAKRAMFFDVSSHFEEKSFKASGVCPLPGLVWQTDGQSLYVYAVKGNATPTRDTPLCQAPLFNVWARGQVCHGSASAPKGDRSMDIDAWERFLFESNFTHPNFAEKDRLIKGRDPHEFWKEMLSTKPEAFPEETLVELDLKVADLLEPDFKNRVNGIRAQGEF